MPKGYKKDPNRTKDTCSHCNLLKSIEEFNWANKTKGTRMSWCRDCFGAYHNIYRNMSENKIIIGARKKTPEYRAKKKEHRDLPEVKAAISTYMKTEKVKIRCSAYWKTPRGKAIHSAYDKTPKAKAIHAAYVKNNPGKINARTRKRRAAKIQRVPIWSERDAIIKFYENCPPGMTVDHIIPLQGKLVSGLHVLRNLQYLSKSENSRKINRFDPVGFNRLDKEDN